MKYRLLMYADETKAPKASKEYQAIRWAEKILTANYGSMDARPLNQWSQKA